MKVTSARAYGIHRKSSNATKNDAAAAATANRLAVTRVTRLRAMPTDAIAAARLSARMPSAQAAPNASLFRATTVTQPEYATGGMTKSKRRRVGAWRFAARPSCGRA